jgi:hypothetical protein
VKYFFEVALWFQLRTLAFRRLTSGREKNKKIFWEKKKKIFFSVEVIAARLAAKRQRLGKFFFSVLTVRLNPNICVVSPEV